MPTISLRKDRKGGQLHLSIAARDLESVQAALSSLESQFPNLNTSQIIVLAIQDYHRRMAARGAKTKDGAS